MSYETRIVGGAVEVTSPRTGIVHSYEISVRYQPYSRRCVNDTVR